MAWKEYSAEYWLKEFQKRMDRCTGRRNITDILLKTALNTIQSINPSTPLENFLPFSSSLELSSANSFNLESLKICRSERVNFYRAIRDHGFISRRV